MRQKKVKRLRKEAIQHIEENNVKFPIADYTRSPWTNAYANFIKQFRRDL